MSETIPTTEPTEFVAGDTVKFDIAQSAEYTIADGWNLTYAFRGPDELDLGASEITENGTTYEVRIPAASTANLSPGLYRWAAYLTSGTERHRYRTGETWVIADLATTAAVETENEKALRLIVEKIEGRLSEDMESFQINGRAINRTPIDTLVKLRGIYEARVWREQNPGRSVLRHEVSFGAP